MNQVLLIGGNYFPKRDASDKNFWVDYLNNTQKKYHIISFNRNGINKIVKNKHTLVFKPYFQLSKKHMIYKKVFQIYLENSLTIIANIRFLNQYIKNNDIKVIHFMDNYGPINYFVKRLLPIKTSISAVSYLPRVAMYDKLLKASMAFDKIITFSNHFRMKLFEMNIPKSNLATIHWGVLPNKSTIQHKKYILWSGYLQQTTYDDFMLSYKIAVDVRKRYKNAEFVFAFKPEHYNNEFTKFEQPGIKILSKCNFKSLAKQASLFLCPVTRKDTIVAPPLTWIELMNYGVPVITNDVAGAQELIDSTNGIICRNEKEFVEKIIGFLKNTKKQKMLRKNAVAKIKQEFDLRKIIRRYETFWEEMAND